MTRTDGDGPTAARARLEERAIPHRRLIRAGPGVLFSPIWQSRSSCPSRPQAARSGLCARPEESDTGSEPGGVTSLSPFAQPVASPPLGVVSDRSADLPCRDYGSHRCAYCRPDPRQSASASGSRLRGQAATLVSADLAPGLDDNQPPCRARRTTASPRRTKRRLRRRSQQGRPCYRFDRRRSSRHGVRAALRERAHRPPRARGRPGRCVIEATVNRKVRRGCSWSPRGRRTDPRGGCFALQADSDLGPQPWIARDCFRTISAAPHPRATRPLLVLEQSPGGGEVAAGRTRNVAILIARPPGI
jgi:hypothetical protein